VLAPVAAATGVTGVAQAMEVDVLFVHLGVRECLGQQSVEVALAGHRSA
jgi:hypothetical protein